MNEIQTNKIERWLVDHSTAILVAFTFLVLIGAGATFYTLDKQGDTQSQVDVLQPQVTRVISAASVCNHKALRQESASQTCAERLRVALLNCREHPRCRAAFLATLQEPASTLEATPREEGEQSSSPRPAGEGTPDGTKPTGKTDPETQKPTPKAKSPPPSGDIPVDTEPVTPEPVFPEPGASGETPAAENGIGVKACVDLAVSACVEAGVGRSTSDSDRRLIP